MFHQRHIVRQSLYQFPDILRLEPLFYRFHRQFSLADVRHIGCCLVQMGRRTDVDGPLVLVETVRGNLSVYHSLLFKRGKSALDVLGPELGFGTKLDIAQRGQSAHNE